MIFFSLHHCFHICSDSSFSRVTLEESKKTEPSLAATMSVSFFLAFSARLMLWIPSHPSPFTFGITCWSVFLPELFFFPLLPSLLCVCLLSSQEWRSCPSLSCPITTVTSWLTLARTALQLWTRLTLWLCRWGIPTPPQHPRDEAFPLTPSHAKVTWPS